MEETPDTPMSNQSSSNAAAASSPSGISTSGLTNKQTSCKLSWLYTTNFTIELSYPNDTTFLLLHDDVTVIVAVGDAMEVLARLNNALPHFLLLCNVERTGNVFKSPPFVRMTLFGCEFRF